MVHTRRPARKGEIPVALTIAGSDSGGGAGIQADLKTFAALGVHGTSAITSVTAQNTLEVRGIHDIPPELVRMQIEAVADDIGVDAAKTGMLSNTGIIEAVASCIDKYSFPLVVDPVMIAKSGARLLREDAVEALKRKLIPKALVVTPNRMEAEVLAGFSIRSIDDARRAARTISVELGCQAVVVKGGHIEGDESVDVLYYNGSYKEYRAPRISDACTHGTGCCFSAAITGFLAKGLGLEEAVRRAKEFVTTAIKYGLRIGKGHCPVNPTAWLEIPAEKHRVLENLSEALELLEKNSDVLKHFFPEVHINLVMSLPKQYAVDENSVAGVPGRITMIKGVLKAPAPPCFGASKHMARAVLTLMEYDPRMRSGMNLAYDPRLVKAAESLGLKVSFFDRKEEPPEVRSVEGATTPWGVREAVRRLGGMIPDVIIDFGCCGKEPLTFIFDENPLKVVKKAVMIARKALEGEKR